MRVTVTFKANGKCYAFDRAESIDDAADTASRIAQIIAFDGANHALNPTLYAETLAMLASDLRRISDNT